MATKLMHCQTCPVLGAVHGLVLIGRFRLTVSLPSSCTKANTGRWGRSQVYEGLLGSVQDGTVAALSCCTALPAVPQVGGAGQRVGLPAGSGAGCACAAGLIMAVRPDYRPTSRPRTPCPRMLTDLMHRIRGG